MKRRSIQRYTLAALVALGTIAVLAPAGGIAQMVADPAKGCAAPSTIHQLRSLSRGR